MICKKINSDQNAKMNNILKVFLRNRIVKEK